MHATLADVPTNAVRRIAIIGAGPSGLAYLERLLSNLAELASELAFDIHVIDPHPFGAGRIWRYEQASELTLNSQAYDITIFPDDAFSGEGPIRSLASGRRTFLQWIDAVRSGSIDLPAEVDREVRAEAGTIGPRDFPTRRLMALYLRWAFGWVCATAPANVAITTHRTSATRVEESSRGQRRVVLGDSPAIDDVHSVIYTVGHTEAALTSQESQLADFAQTHGLTYLPPQPASADLLEEIAPSSNVIIRGMGLTAFDQVTLLTEHRGGRFQSSAGVLRYIPSRGEPTIYLGSRRGVVPRTVPSCEIRGIPTQPKHFTLEVALALKAEKGLLSLRRDLWPLMLRDITLRTYAELFTGYPERVRMSWADFEAAVEGLEIGSAAFNALVVRAVPEAGDRFDFAALQRPFQSDELGSVSAHQQAVRELIRRELELHRNASTTLALRNAMRSAYQVTAVLKSLPDWEGASLVDEFHGWWYPLYCSVAVAPSQDAHERLLALSEAGVVHFLGPDTNVSCDAASGQFVATSSVTGTRVVASSLIEGRIALPQVAGSANPVLRSLAESGRGVDAQYQDRHTGRLKVTEREYFLIDAEGKIDFHQQALGVFANANWVGAFALPNADFPFFRQADAVAQATLKVLIAA